MAAPLRPLVRDPGREMFERFTERARRVLVLAQEEARFLEHNFIGTEHLLLGLVREADGVAAKALGELGIGLDDVRQRVKETIGPAGSPMTSSPPFTPRAKKVLELSLREALQLQHNYIGTEHILLGLVREGEGVAARVLVSLGADLSRVRQKVVDLLGTDPAAGLFEDPNDLRRSASPPRCGRCDASLAESARYRTIEVPPDEDEAGSGQGPVRATLPYCSFCGTVIGPPSEARAISGGPVTTLATARRPPPPCPSARSGSLTNCWARSTWKMCPKTPGSSSSIATTRCWRAQPPGRGSTYEVG
jgi:hypothetical protein